jgi:endonuclease/exonuclease/phosphatase (EEP) superfamily protein YafD
LSSGFRSVDYILHRPAASWRLIEVRVLEERVASDHRPLLAVYEVALKMRSP